MNPPSPSENQQGNERRRPAVGLCFAFFNAALLCVATNWEISHRPVNGFDSVNGLPFLRQLAVFVEGLLLMAPGILASVSVRRWLRVSGYFWIAVMVVIWILEVALFGILGFHLCTPEMWSVLHPGLDWTLRKLNFDLCVKALAWIVPFVLTEGIVFGAAYFLSHDSSVTATSRRTMAVSLTLFAVVVSILGYNRRALYVDALVYPQYHLSSALGLIKPGRALPFSGAAQDRIDETLIALAENSLTFRDHYQRAAIEQRPSKRLPDVVIVIAETLRADALRADVSPNLWAFGQSSARSLLHFSSGNASVYGFYGVLTGVDPSQYGQASKWPAILPELFRDLGYYRAFYATTSLDHVSGQRIYDFLSRDQFDEFDVGQFAGSKPEEWCETDRRLAAKGRRLLDRQPDEPNSVGDRPVLLIYYPMGTHCPYQTLPAYRQNLPTVGEDEWPEPYTKNRPALINKYLNAVRTMDAAVAPLLKDDSVVVVVGDHGQSLWEDGRFLYASSISWSQTTTPFLVHAPGHPAQELAGPTTHLDILPTLLDLLGAQLNNPDVMTGQSVFSTAPRKPFTVKSPDCLGLVTGRGDKTRMFRCQFDPSLPLLNLIAEVDQQGYALDNPSATIDFEPQFLELAQQLLPNGLPKRSRTQIIAQGLSSDNSTVRCLAANLAERHPADAISCLTVLQERLNDPDSAVRNAAARALSAVWSASTGTR